MIGNVKIAEIQERGASAGRYSCKKELEIVSRVDHETTSPYSDQTVEQAIRLALKGIRYGSIEIIIHDSRVVQIERKEKTRF